MSPESMGCAVSRGRWALSAFVLCGATAAWAVVGGGPDDGPLSRSAVMVLSARGAVCSAIVIAPDAVLTAGHCASGGGDYRVNVRGQDGAPVLLEPAAIAVHPGYDKGAVAGRRRSIDLALVRLRESLPAHVTTIALSTGMPRAGAAIVLGGYGVAREGDGRSTGTFRTARLTAVEPYGPGKILLWASASGGGAGACQGDSGGPMAESDGAVAAVTSWASGAAKAGCGAMSQGVLVAPQREWIDRTLAGWGRSATWR